jgi:hypothetical protein
VKRWFIQWVVMSVSLLSLFQDHQPILTPSNTLTRKDVLILYYKDGCPYAHEVIGLLHGWIEPHPHFELKTVLSTPPFPSPTLRIPLEDFYINYIGVKAIKEAIKTTILN